jgi:hypothetical protein
LASFARKSAAGLGPLRRLENGPVGEGKGVRGLASFARDSADLGRRRLQEDGRVGEGNGVRRFRRFTRIFKTAEGEDRSTKLISDPSVPICVNRRNLRTPYFPNVLDFAILLPAASADWLRLRGNRSPSPTSNDPGGLASFAP